MEGNRIVAKDDDYLPLSKFEEYSQHELRSNDVIVATVGSHPTQPGSVVGRTARISHEFSGSFLNQNAVCLRINRPDLINQRFLFYLSRTILFKHHIESRARGSANQVRMAIGELKKFTVDYPPLEDQKKIAAILSAYDDLIENNRRRIVLLEQMAENLYREWFVRMRFPGYQTAKFVKGVPVGWNYKSIGELCEFISRGPSIDYVDDADGIPVLNQKCIRNGEIELESVKCARELSDEKSLLYLRDHDVLINSMGEGTLGRVSRNLSVSSRMIIHNCITVLRVKRDAYSQLLLYYNLASMQNYLVLLGQGSTGQTSLKETLIKKIKIAAPPKILWQEFNKFVEPIWQELATIKQQNLTLVSTRELLLPRLISGKLPVENLDIMFPPSMEDAA